VKTGGRALALTLGILLAVLLGVVVGAVMCWLVFQRFGPPTRVAGSPIDAQPGVVPAGAGRTSVPSAVSEQSQDAITAAIARVGPAVVNIDTSYQPVVRDPMERILRNIMGIPTDPFPRKGQGSGIIIDGERGHILTNAHVVRGAAHVGVSLADGQHFEAQVVGIDPLSEIAVLKVPGGELPAATLGSADELPIGSWVIAIGNPFGFENTVTVGVLSAKDRQIKGPDGTVLQDLLQTDASINPGNSGGALVDLNGNVVGMPTAIIPYAQGIGFAVSVDVAKQVAERLIATGRMPWLGISHRDIAPDEARELRLPEPRGALVVSAVRGGPAARAGIRQRDVITGLGGRSVANAKELSAAVRSHDAGERVQITIWREGGERTLSVTLGEVPQAGLRQLRASPPGSGSRG